MENPSEDEIVHISKLIDEQLKLLVWHGNVACERMTETIDPIMRDKTLTSNNKYSACLLALAGFMHNLADLAHYWSKEEVGLDKVFEQMKHIDSMFERSADVE